MLLQLTARGLWCEPADIYIDPWAPVDRAVVTHAHATICGGAAGTTW